MPYVLAEINDTEKPGLLVGRIIRPDNGNVIDYQTAEAGNDEKSRKENREKFQKSLDTKAAAYKARIEQSEKSGVTESKGAG